MGWVWLAVVACAGETDGDCLELPAECTPQYDPDFDGVWANTLSGSCALSGCHGQGSEGGGLGLGDDADSAHDALMPYVEPGDASCSQLLEHLEPAGSGKPMPPGSPLDEAELCSVRTWIADGAMR